MRNQKGKVMLLLMVLILLISNIAYGDRDTTQIKNKPTRSARFHGSRAVWEFGSNEIRDIYYLDISTGIETKVSSGFKLQSNPDIWQDYIVWQGERDTASSKEKHYDIYIYMI
ncbi:hypothetical protein [Proteiniborus sp.]|uniref:hypothetical protein n=1 Tax=Proteiniborus sp. TaxID=2079015 RepID=UPI00331712CF